MRSTSLSCGEVGESVEATERAFGEPSPEWTVPRRRPGDAPGLCRSRLEQAFEVVHRLSRDRTGEEDERVRGLRTVLGPTLQPHDEPPERGIELEDGVDIVRGDRVAELVRAV
jgi:hypothetical protein